MSKRFNDLDNDSSLLDNDGQEVISVVNGNPAETQEEDPNDPQVKRKNRIMLMKATAGEFLCTYLFVFVVLATAVNTDRLMKHTGVTNPVVEGLSVAFAAIALIYSFADISGAHFNPAVTFATLVTRRTSVVKCLCYWVAQILGAVGSAVTILAIYPSDSTGDGNTVTTTAVRINSDVSIWSAFATETILTFILVYVIFAVAFDTVDSKNNVQVVNKTDGGKGQKIGGRNLTIYATTGTTKAGFAPFAIGFTLGFLCFLGSTTSGGAFNPARAFASSLVGVDWSNHWLYWVADFIGAALAGLIQKYFFSHNFENYIKQNDNNDNKDNKEMQNP